MNALVLKNHGIDSVSGLNRCLGDEDMYTCILGMFLEDDSYDRLKAAYLNNDLQAQFKCAHELKGACGNASLTELYETVSKLVEYLRGGGSDAAAINEMFASVTTSYLRAREGIALVLS